MLLVSSSPRSKLTNEALFSSEFPIYLFNKYVGIIINSLQYAYCSKTSLTSTYLCNSRSSKKR